MKKSNLFLLICMFAVVIFISAVYSQEEIPPVGDEPVSDDVSTADAGSQIDVSTTENEEVSFADENAELQETEGITPDSPLYFADEFLDRFGDDLNVREEKVAEIKAMVQEGKIDEARIALERYEQHADNLEREVSPEQGDEARRSAAAIHNTLREIQDEIPENNRQEFVNDVLDKEEKIVTASEIAGKIRDLCRALSDLDPLEYSSVCKTNEDAPDWQKKLDKELTDGQREEAKLFGDIMSECFRTAGQQCRCEEIPFSDFAETCSKAAPLATACEIEKNEEACEQLDSLEMPELPEHLQDVFDSLEGNIRESQFEVHTPRECREAGTTKAQECIEIMFRQNAPGPCLNALDRGEISFTNEREAREACEEIMFKENAPQECVEQGIRNPRECGKLMFQLNAPQECLDAGLTGEHRSDQEKCRVIMGSQGRGPQGEGPPALGIRCREIQDSEERLKCYDSASQGIGQRVERVEMARQEVRDYRQIEGQKCPDNICDEFEQTHPYACPADCGGTQEFNEFQEPREFTEPNMITEGTFETTPTTGGETTTSNSGTTGSVIFDDIFSRYYFK